MIRNILGLFVKTLSRAHKYSLLNRENLKKPIQMQSYQKQKLFSQLFPVILKSRLNFQYFQKKDDPHSRYILKIMDSEKRG